MPSGCVLAKAPVPSALLPEKKKTVSTGPERESAVGWQLAEYDVKIAPSAHGEQALLPP